MFTRRKFFGLLGIGAIPSITSITPTTYQQPHHRDIFQLCPFIGKRVRFAKAFEHFKYYAYIEGCLLAVSTNDTFLLEEDFPKGYSEWHDYNDRTYFMGIK